MVGADVRRDVQTKAQFNSRDKLGRAEVGQTTAGGPPEGPGGPVGFVSGLSAKPA